jgi:hypothetical protein
VRREHDFGTFPLFDGNQVSNLVRINLVNMLFQVLGNQAGNRFFSATNAIGFKEFQQKIGIHAENEDKRDLLRFLSEKKSGFCKKY